jgi:hypothetical protein
LKLASLHTGNFTCSAISVNNRHTNIRIKGELALSNEENEQIYLEYMQHKKKQLKIVVVLSVLLLIFCLWVELG